MEERRKVHECIQEENISIFNVFMGRAKEFMDSQKGTRTLQFSIVGIIIIQVGAFLIMWGSLTTTVKVHDKSIDTLMSKFNNIKIIGYVQAEETK